MSLYDTCFLSTFVTFSKIVHILAITWGESMISLSVCMIVKNEEDVLARCLSCAKQVADEIIVVDTGSTDKTKQIAKKFTRKVYDFEWCDDFSKARNFSFSKATKEYIMWLDADDIILEEDIKKLLSLKKELAKDPVDMVMLQYQMGIPKEGVDILSYYRERIFKREKQYQWVSPIHEVIVPSGNTIQREIAITHDKLHPSPADRNLNIFRHMIASGMTLEPRQQFYFARELSYNNEIEESIQRYSDFLDTPYGWEENKINACLDLARLYHNHGKQEKVLPTLLRSFEFDEPRAEICCELGNYFLEHHQVTIATYWYHQALTRVLNLKNGGFYMKDCYDFIPYLQLCVCYDRLGNHELASAYNESAGKLKPNHASYLANKKYFEKILKNS